VALFYFFFHVFEDMVECVYLLEDIGQFGVILLKFCHFGLKFGICCFDFREEGKLYIIDLGADTLDFIFSEGDFRSHFC
jgi:hypothetical protein